MDWRRPVLGTMKSKIVLSLLVCCVASGVFSAVHFFWPGNVHYARLTALTTIVGIVTLVWAWRAAPETCSIAFQAFWWVALFVTWRMVLIDSQTHTADGLPAIVLVPAMATPIIKALSGLRASVPYSIGVVGFLVPTAMVYDQWEDVGLLIVLSIFAVMFMPSNNQIDANELLNAILVMKDQARIANEAVNGTKKCDSTGDRINRRHQQDVVGYGLGPQPQIRYDDRSVGTCRE